MKTDFVLNLQQTLAQYLEPSDLLDAILALLPQLGADFGSVVAQTGDGSIYFRSSLPGQEDLVGPAGRRFARKLLAEGLEGRVLRSGQPEVVEDLSADPRRYRAAYLIDGCHGAVLLPFALPRLKGGGLLILGSERPAAFSAENLPLLQAVARHIGFALESTLLYCIQRDSTAQLRLINEVSRAATSILNINLMLSTVAQAIQRSFGFYNVRIYRQQPDAPLTLAALTDLRGRTVLPAREAPAPSPFVERAVAQSRTLVANDAKADPAYTPPPEGRKIRSCLAIPIKLGAKIVGAMELDSTRLDAFPPSLVAAMETLCDQLAVAMENALLYDELNQTINELLALNRITQSVSATLDFQQTLTLIARHVTAMLNVAATSVVLRDDDAGEVWFAAAWGEGAEAVLNRRLSLGEGIVGWVALHGKPLIVPNVWDDPRFYPEMDRQSG
ncbi:MAG: GAF domain-containing protein, partial [Caldilineae bacterium]